MQKQLWALSGEGKHSVPAVDRPEIWKSRRPSTSRKDSSGQRVQVTAASNRIRATREGDQIARREPATSGRCIRPSSVSNWVKGLQTRQLRRELRPQSAVRRDPCRVRRRITAYCGATSGLTLDHYGIPKNEGGNFVLFSEADGVPVLNLVVLCRSCNSAKGEIAHTQFFDAITVERVRSHQVDGNFDPA